MKPHPPLFRPIAVGSLDYVRELELRDELLRRPLGLRLVPVDPKQEQADLHFGLFGRSGALLACAVASPLPGHAWRIRQVAVARAWQKRGLGRRLMQETEKALRARGARRLILHARATVEGFYRTLGYRVSGPGFVEVSIPHVPMEKEIADNE